MISSIITPTAKIDSNNWSVTLVRAKPNQHALLVFEGVRESYFARVAHLHNKEGPYSTIKKNLFNRVAIVNIGREYGLNEFKNNYAKKTPTWIITRQKIEDLIEKIDRESECHNPFFMLGSKSFIAKKVETYAIHDNLLRHFAEKNKELFLNLYDSWVNEGKPTRMSRSEFRESIKTTVELIKSDERIMSKFPELFKEGTEFNYNFFMSLFEKEMITKNDMMQQSCFTWARTQLESIGIEGVESKIGSVFSGIISITQFSAQYSAFDDGIHLVIDLSKKNIRSEIQENEKKPLHRVVTYNKNRDKRTHAKKTIDDVNKKENVLAVAAVTSSFSTLTVIGVGVGLSSVGIVASPVVTPIYLASAVTSFVMAGWGIKNARKRKKLKKDEKILGNLTKNEHSELDMKKGQAESTKLTVSPFPRFDMKVKK